MIIIPAIDIKNGKCVRLTQGDFEREKVYSDNPVAIAKQWEAQGAPMLHIVDLDGAKNGILANFEVIKNITQSVDIPIQVGGGIRSLDLIKQLIKSRATRIVLGTIAVENKPLLKEMLRFFGEYICVALDVKNGELMKQGWLANSNKSVSETARKLEKIGVRRFIYTDIVTDGTLTEPNYVEIAAAIENVSVPVIISGGIATINAVKKIKSLGVKEIIIGKALYENKFTLKEALRC